MKVYERTENGTGTIVERETGLAEINAAMMGEAKRTVRTMSSINRTDYAIEYRDGRSVRLVLVDAPAETPCCEHATMYHGRSGCDLCGCQADRATLQAHQGAASAPIAEQPVTPVVAQEPDAEDSAPWTVASHRTLLHKFTEATEDGRAVCNKSYRPWRYGNGYDFKTKAERAASEYADLYTFCPRCDAK
ncbi:hypothetical protein ACWGLE_00990 [Streptomyces sp. NPDC055897]